MLSVPPPLSSLSTTPHSLPLISLSPGGVCRRQEAKQWGAEDDGKMEEECGEKLLAPKNGPRRREQGQ